ncbi:hypothetical protein QE152_g23570 [Popillia japonica]|uniref:Uncharacterized protein n=1 Tax=Popillia japonica TaxID=7064 RepID=A0AAW1KEN5_POPJA
MASGEVAIELAGWQGTAEGAKPDKLNGGIQSNLRRSTQVYQRRNKQERKGNKTEKLSQVRKRTARIPMICVLRFQSTGRKRRGGF